jgi:hypothetical protein
MGRGMIDDVSDQMFGRFSANMKAALAANAASAAPAATRASGVDSTAAMPIPLAAEIPPRREEVLDVGALGAGAAKRAAGRLWRSPGLWRAIAALEAVALLVLWLSR